jgi:hypothetical protein
MISHAKFELGFVSVTKTPRNKFAKKESSDQNCNSTKTNKKGTLK